MTRQSTALAVVETRAAPEQTLLDMLVFKRPASSWAEKEFIKTYVKPLGATPDAIGNYWLRIGESRVLWSCHTDSVHAAPGYQRLTVKGDVVTSTDGDCLGADCATGVWLMREMILAGVPGVYVFHRGEERGGWGSKHVADFPRKRLDGIDFAIAFDRKGTNSIITHQGCERTASDAFAASLACLLPGAYAHDDGGTFTDTANYSKLIAECTNISVGYHDQHTTRESQSISHALKLADAMRRFDETALVAARDKARVEYQDFGRDAWPWDDSSPWNRETSIQPDDPGTWRGSRKSHPASIRALVAAFPDEVADLLEQYGYDRETLAIELGVMEYH